MKQKIMKIKDEGELQYFLFRARDCIYYPSKNSQICEVASPRSVEQ